MKVQVARVFVLGVLIAVGFQWIQARAFDGDWTGMLGVGDKSDLQPMILAELGHVQQWPGGGHDGQINYAVARDPTGQTVPPLLDHAGYRYRRILYPLLAGLGGLAPPRLTLAGLVAWAAIGMGLTAVGAFHLARHYRLRSWFWLGVVLSPGLWLGAQLLTSDTLGFGLALLGVAFWVLERRGLALLCLGLAPLAKDQFALVGLAVAFSEAPSGRRHTASKLALATIVPTAAWAAVVEARLGGGFSPRGNFDWPLAGIIESGKAVWGSAPGKDQFYTVLALTGLAVAIAGGLLTTDRMLRWLALTWAAVGLTASSWVWDFGNNSARVLTPALVFGATAMAQRMMARRRRQPAPPLSSDQFP